MVRGALWGLAYGFVFVIFFVIDCVVRGSPGNTLSGKFFARPGSIGGALLYIVGVLVLIAAAVLGGYFGNRLWPGPAGAIAGGVGAYALVWFIGGAVHGASRTDGAARRS